MHLKPRETPCGSCPYRKDCPSGVWHESEYEKLIQYDKDTGEQPHGVFMCHSNNDQVTICRGWLDTHPKEHMLALRLAASVGQVPISIFDLPKSEAPTFASGAEAAAHGMVAIEQPPPEAVAVIRKLAIRKRKQKGKGKGKGKDAQP